MPETNDTQPATETDATIEVPPEQVRAMMQEAMRQEQAAREVAIRRDKLQMIAAFVAGGICSRDAQSPLHAPNHAPIAKAAVAIALAIILRVDAEIGASSPLVDEAK